LAASIGSVFAADKPATGDGNKEVPKAAEKSATTSSQFSTLKGVKAVEMATAELDAVKGQHIHFVLIDPSTTCPGPTCVPHIPNASPKAAPIDGLIHLVNHKENNLGNGQAPAGSGPGYSGMCGAALKSPALWIPGQNPVTGIGGGCF
jgi:hypothetical protein